MTWASATPSPREEEWWFGTWDIQDKVWSISKGRGVTVALIDTGVNAALPDLRGAVLPGTNIVGPKGNGLIDSDKGFGHGTAMAALIAGQGTGTGMVGIAPEAKIISIRSDVEDLVPAIDYAVKRGAKVINVSMGLPSTLAAGGCRIELQRAISRAIEKDIVLIAGAGNDASTGVVQSEPALCPGFMAVGAVDYEFHPWFDSQPAPYVVAAAPGVHVGSIGKTGTFIPNLDGTSGSSALTTGVAALVRSKYPDMPAREVVQRIVATTRDIGVSGRDDKTGYGLIRPYHALIDTVSKNAPNPVFSAWDNSKKTYEAAPRQSISGSNKQKSSSSAESDFPWARVAVLVGAIGFIVIGVLVFLVRRRPGDRLEI
ncbi:type VII secretion-associated serine protease mycosin [Actinoallomurus vinaceus]|uniref:Type VII secretion-associated serine protease mycosin n=2 Tax=Actinoallomurus vinaceus TaxID=1080074 RepID=A0ABP8UBG5_9ACTN